MTGLGSVFAISGGQRGRRRPTRFGAAGGAGGGAGALIAGRDGIAAIDNSLLLGPLLGAFCVNSVGI